MTGWDLTPSGVQHVLDKTGRAARELGDTIAAYGGPEGDLLKAAQAAGTLRGAGDEAPAGKPGPDGAPAPGGLLAAALGEFAQKTQRDLTFLVARTVKSVDGAADAARQYIEGDGEMKANATLHKALGAPDLHVPANGHDGHGADGSDGGAGNRK
ncbi:DUF6507 family protein [Streptomyces pinistramenti]|uniref:DUF6507 family protein n=1 Tax=Streptomyces pinistramenti TaxID=2884812 RepID=UPI001D06DED4|nr:DUF6507 family protein [Streptomyces pinistramenti]MCB5907921.1 DUF6507 family protein [Streptomyces pinistramenti]